MSDRRFEDLLINGIIKIKPRRGPFGTHPRMITYGWIGGIAYRQHGPFKYVHGLYLLPLLIAFTGGQVGLAIH